ncbi:MAG: non-ribosomal peptide synthetase, partial [Tumebacillaceae bacterium]
KLRQLCQQTGVTMFMALLAAFQVLMYRYTGEEDILIGSPIANRQRPELEGLIGFFANTIVLRSSLDGNMSFLQLLAQVRQTTLDAYANQDMPFEKIVEEVQPQRNGMQSPMFNVMFVQDPVMSELRMSGLTFSHIANESSTAKFDITLTVSDAGDEIVGVWEYRTGLFDRTTIERMHRHLEHLVQDIVNHPDRTLSELQLLTEEERHQIVFDWNDTTVEYPQDVCLHQLFEQQVERTPDAVAVVFEEQELTYRELNEQANRLAHYLQKQQVGPEVLVGVCMERSLEMVISLYGILKAGGAFVPIDPSYPSDRLSYLLEDSQIQVLLTQEKWVDTLPNVSSVSIICLDLAEELLADESTENLPTAATVEHAAYMIYTSGSTGKPKGVLNTHKGIVNRLLWMKETYELTPDDRVLQKTPFSFDVSVWEFFWPLLTGARLVVARPEGHRDSRYLIEAIQRYGITALHFVPSMLQLFLEETGVEQCRSVRHVMTSGEALSYELQKRFFACLDAELHNLYGPTEAAIEVTYWECDPDSHLSFVPIGRPIANTRIYVLDQHLQPVPIGVAGELHIGGVQVARGYHNRPDLTAEKFIPNPFVPGERLYKTGDLARFLPDGNVQYMGRLDYQVKIRGQRVEMGEIEEVLMQQTDVRDAVAVVREDVPGDQRLVAYLVVHEAEAFDANELRNFLKK